MPSIKWQHAVSVPLQTTKIVILSLLRSLPATYDTLFAPSYPLTLRTAIARIWIGTSFSYLPDLWYSEPASHNVHSVNTNGTATYIIPTSSPEEIQSADAVYIHVHGGGMAIGHPLQYLDEYKRWVALAAKKGKKLVILAPTYPLSPRKKWPAQRDAVAALYEWLLASFINPSKIVMGGDSAGADLTLLFLLHTRSTSPTTPLPSGIILHSPSIDMTASLTRFTPRIKYDYMFAYSDIVLLNNDLLRPEGLPFDTPEISALLWDDVSGLPAQLVLWSSTEVLASDAERWVEKSKGAGNQVQVFERGGMLHTFSLGWPFVGRELQDECDELVVGFIFGHV